MNQACRMPPVSAMQCRDDPEVRLYRAHSLNYLAYIPDNAQPTLEPIVFVHGYKRRGKEQLEQLRRISDASGRALFAPCFCARQHPRYQRLGKGRDHLRADTYFNACLKDATRRHGIGTDRFVLAGFSGGAQFSHRYTMAHPQRVTRLIAIAAGWYTFPDAEIPYPHGLATARKLRATSLNPEAFLRVPTAVLIGARDLNTVNLRCNPGIDDQQGLTRVERARRWVLAMREAARRYRVEADIRYQEVPGIGHSFDHFVRRGQLLELILGAITDPLRTASSAPVSRLGSAVCRVVR